MISDDAETKPNVLGVTQARMGSSRLPGKTLSLLRGKPLLAWHTERMAACKTLTKYAVATTTAGRDDIIETFCDGVGVACLRGSEEDVLSRYVLAARKWHADVIVRVTGDCPLIDPEIVDFVVGHFLKNRDRLDYACLDITRYVRGFDVEVFSRQALEEIAALALQEDELEHVTLGIRRRPDRFRIEEVADASLACCDPPPRMCVDTAEDMRAVEAMLAALHAKGLELNWRNVLRLVSEVPEIIEINKDIEQIIP